MGCEYGGISVFSSSLNEMLFLFVIVAFLYVFVTQSMPEIGARLESDGGL